eukprot:15477545-Alexandrium_andersonii.AAC.1
MAEFVGVGWVLCESTSWKSMNEKAVTKQPKTTSNDNHPASKDRRLRSEVPALVPRPPLLQQC